MNNQGPQLIAQLRLLVRREHDLLRELVDTMTSERGILLHGGELDAILQEKQNLLEQLEAATQARLQWLRREGIPPNQQELRHHLDALDSTGALGAEIAAFEATAAECQRCNISLSPIIRRRHHHLNRAASSLGLGLDFSEASYSSHGQSLAEADTRHLGVA